MSKHTPGPWVIGALESGKAAVDGPNGEEVTGWVEIQDAHLIAAAPDLLEACEALLDAVVRRDHKDKALRTARAAIAKANGQSSSTDTARATE